jgi:hypothetical protein
MPVGVHPAAHYLQHDWLSMPGTYYGRGGGIAGEMNVVAAALVQTLSPDRLQEAHGRPVVQDQGRFSRLVAEIDLNRVTLVGPDVKAVLAKRESLLIASRHYMDEVLAGERVAGIMASDEQLVNRCPSGVVERETECVRLVAEDEA